MNPKVLIIGAGPAGLAIASQLNHEFSLDYELVDLHGVAGGSYRFFYPNIGLASPTSLTRLPGNVEVVDTEYVTTGQYAEYLERYAEYEKIHVTERSVKRIYRQGSAWMAEDDTGKVYGPYQAVVAATGMASFPKMVALKGEGVEQMHSKDWKGVQASWRGVVVIGAATSAVELAEACAVAGVRVILSTRKKKVKTLPKLMLGRDLHYFLKPLEALPKFAFKRYCKQYPTVLGTDNGFWDAVREDKIQIHGPIQSLSQGKVLFEDGTFVEADVVIHAVGFSYETNYLPDDVARYPHGPITDKHGQSVSHEGLFFMGMPCVQGISSEFLRGIAKDAPRLRAYLKLYLNR